jgi:hypothetical protein
MVFPAEGHAIPTAGNNISLNKLRLSYVNNGNNHTGEGDWNNGDGRDTTQTQISFSDFDYATFTDGSSIGEGAISIETHFCGKTFGSSGSEPEPEEEKKEPEPEGEEPAPEEEKKEPEPEGEEPAPEEEKKEPEPEGE